MTQDRPKTHYRKVLKSDHLSVADLEDFIEQGSNMSFTISHVRQEFGKTVAGRKGDFNIAYFKEKIKPLVLNATNAKSLKSITGSAFIEDWTDIQVNLWIDHSAGIGGNITGGVRINPMRKIVRETLTKAHKHWGKAVDSFRQTGNLNKVKERMILSKEDEEALIAEAKNG